MIKTNCNIKRLLLLSSIFWFIQLAVAQQDSVNYIKKNGDQTTKDSAFLYTIFGKHGNVWHGKTYYASNNKLQSDGDFADMDCNIPLGAFTNYKEDGTLDNTAIYDNGKLSEKTYYYKNGNKKSHVVFNGDKITEQKGWDENGKEIPGFIVVKPASFKGGEQGWIKYLQKHLNGNVPSDAGAPAGNYSVVVEFMVSKEGYISN